MADNGAQALELLHRDEEPLRPALVLTDMNMPRTGGAELLRALRADPVTRELPVIMLIGSDLDPGAGHGPGPDGYLVKPVTGGQFRELARAVGLGWTDLAKSGLGAEARLLPACPAVRGTVV